MNAIADLLNRKNDVSSQLQKVDAELTKKRSSLGAAVLAGGDVDKLTGEVSRLEARRAALAEAAGLADKMTSEQEQTDDFERAAAELAEIDELLHTAVLDALRRLYAWCDELEALKARYSVAHGYLYAKYFGRLNGARIGKTWGVLNLILNAVKPLRRQIELMRPDLVAESGERRRFQ